MFWRIYRLTGPFESRTDYPEQLLPMHRLAQESHRTGAQRLVFLFLACMGAEEDDGNTGPDLLLSFGTGALVRSSQFTVHGWRFVVRWLACLLGSLP